jgi:hypothetical protein
MPSQNGNGGRRGPWGSGAKSGSDLEDLVRQGQDRLNQIMPSGGLRPAIVLAVVALIGLEQNQVGTNRKLIGREFSMPMPKTRHGSLTGSLGDQSCEPPFWFHRLLAAFNAAA